MMTEAVAQLEDLPPEYVAFDEGRFIYGWMVAMAAIATCAVGLRFWARKAGGAGLRPDDWLVIASLVGL